MIALVYILGLAHHWFRNYITLRLLSTAAAVSSAIECQHSWTIFQQSCPTRPTHFYHRLAPYSHWLIPGDNNRLRFQSRRIPQ